MAVQHRLSHHFLETRSVLAFNAGVILRDPSAFVWGSRTRLYFFEEFEREEPTNPRWIHKLPPQPSVLDRILFPVYSFTAWMRLLCDNYDWRFITMVVCGQHLLKGMLAGGGSQGLLVVEGLIYMRLHVGASLKTLYQAIGSSAWGLKPLYALISDAFDFHGYRRTPWIVITAIFATLAYLTLVLERASGALVCLCFFVAKLQLAWTDLMVEATYTEKMREVPEYSADIVSFAWSGIGLFGIIGIFVAGPGIDLLGPIMLLALAIPFSSLIVFPACAGYLTEKKVPKAERGRGWEQVWRQRNYFLCTVILTVSVVITIISGMMHMGSGIQALIGTIVCIVTGVSAMVLLPAAVWKPMVYLFLCNALNLSTGGFVDNFYLDPATRHESEQTGYPVCENCPHFSATFYYTVIGVCDSVFTLVGSFVFSRYMANWTYHRALCVSQILCIATGFLDIIQYQRWNIGMGLPDWVFMLGKSSVQNTLGMINFMPTTILISKVCPHGLEASVFALLAGFSNFGLTISGYLGAYALELIGMDHVGKGATDDFSHAWKACIIGVMFTPITLIVLPLLIPAASMTAELPRDTSDEDEENMRLVTNGSNLFDFQGHH